MDVEAVDFAMSAWRSQGEWHLERLPDRSATTLKDLVASLGAHNAEAGALGLVSIADEFFLLLRVRDGRVRLLLSDLGAAADWPLAAEAVAMLGVEAPNDADEVDLQPVGDLTLLTDLGLSAAELSLLCDDVDLYPDEVLAAVARTLGFGSQFDAEADLPG
jgi:putative tRNA adenosine deaminase-associated protein